MNKQNKNKQKKKQKRLKKINKRLEKLNKKLSKNIIHYRCMTEKDDVPESGCGHIFSEQNPSSTVKCPKCGNFWVKWVNYTNK